MRDVRDLLREAVGSYEPRGDQRAIERRVGRHRRAQRVSAAVVGLGVFGAAGWFAWTMLRPVEGTVGAEPTPSEAVSLGELPVTGVAVGSGDAVELVGLDGSIVARLPGYTLAGNPGAPGVWLQREGDYFSLDVGAGALIPVPADEARALIYDEGPEPLLARPTNAASEDGGPAGHWRYAIESARTTLAQWSGVCEVPVAYWIEEGENRIVTGGVDLAAAPASLALGWSPSGEAVVLVFTGDCGSTADAPGIYLVASPGSTRLLYATGPEGSVLVDAWGTGL
jgi:hypothetical protein